MKKIGIYPGTFDPVHRGHLAFAAEAAKQCKLDEIVFLPETSPRGKLKVSPIEARVSALASEVAMLRAVKVIRLDHERFTVTRTLPELQRLYANAELTLLIGSDVARTLRYRWENLDVLLRSMSLVIGMRADDTIEEITAITTELQHNYDLAGSPVFVRTKHDGLSSTQLRKTDM